ncbi:MAG: hypothetical protein MHM6MM_007091 [Cercozoa sp. M6MM]
MYGRKFARALGARTRQMSTQTQTQTSRETSKKPTSEWQKLFNDWVAPVVCGLLIAKYLFGDKKSQPDQAELKAQDSHQTAMLNAGHLASLRYAGVKDDGGYEPGVPWHSPEAEAQRMRELAEAANAPAVSSLPRHHGRKKKKNDQKRNSNNGTPEHSETDVADGDSERGDLHRPESDQPE